MMSGSVLVEDALWGLYLAITSFHMGAEVAHYSTLANQWADIQSSCRQCGEYAPSTILEIGENKITV
jgi:hypothetical protein